MNKRRTKKALSKWNAGEKLTQNEERAVYKSIRRFCQSLRRLGKSIKEADNES